MRTEPHPIATVCQRYARAYLAAQGRDDGYTTEAEVLADPVVQAHLFGLLCDENEKAMRGHRSLRAQMLDGGSLIVHTMRSNFERWRKTAELTRLKQIGAAHPLAIINMQGDIDMPAGSPVVLRV